MILIFQLLYILQDLSRNNIGHVGCVSICDMLYNSGLMVDLNLSGNLFGDKEAILIAETIKVAALSLSVNANINFNMPSHFIRYFSLLPISQTQKS